MLKAILWVLAGVATSFAIVFATDALFQTLSAIPPPQDSSDREAMRLYVASQPVWLMALMVLGWAVAAFAGAAVAARFANYGQKPGRIVAIFFVAATTSNFFILEHPVWMVVSGLLLALSGGLLGARTGAAAAVK